MALLQTEILLGFISCPGGLSQTIPQVKKLAVEVLGWCGHMWDVLDALPNSLKLCWRHFMVEKLTFNYLATALVDIPGISMPIACSLNLRHLWHCVVTTVYFSDLLLYKVHLCNDHAF
jgi:hypothetical protein